MQLKKLNSHLKILFIWVLVMNIVLLLSQTIMIQIMQFGLLNWVQLTLLFQTDRLELNKHIIADCYLHLLLIKHGQQNKILIWNSQWELLNLVLQRKLHIGLIFQEQLHLLMMHWLQPLATKFFLKQISHMISRLLTAHLQWMLITLQLKIMKDWYYVLENKFLLQLQKQQVDLNLCK